MLSPEKSYVLDHLRRFPVIPTSRNMQYHIFCPVHLGDLSPPPNASTREEAPVADVYNGRSRPNKLGSGRYFDAPRTRNFLSEISIFC